MTTSLVGFVRPAVELTEEEVLRLRLLLLFLRVRAFEHSSVECVDVPWMKHHVVSRSGREASI